MTPSESSSWQRRNESLKNPLSLAPAFAVLLGLCAAVASGFLRMPLSVSLCLAILAVCAWALLGSEKMAEGWTALFVLLLLLTLLASFVALRRLHMAAKMPPYLDTQARVVMEREWGRRRAMLLDTPYGRAVAYADPERARPVGWQLRIRGALFDLDGASDRGGFNEALFCRAGPPAICWH